MILCKTIPVLLNDGMSGSVFGRQDSQFVTELRYERGKKFNVVLTSTFVRASRTAMKTRYTCTNTAYLIQPVPFILNMNLLRDAVSRRDKNMYDLVAINALLSFRGSRIFSMCEITMAF